MGYIINHTIICEGIPPLGLRSAWKKAKSIFPYVSPISRASTNGSTSFFIPPDGSKEGWPESKQGDKRREKFKEFLRGKRCVDWVEVSFGADDTRARIVD